MPLGPLCGVLKKGESVTLADGSVIAPDQCVASTSRGASVAVIECVSLAAFRELKAHPTFAGFKDEAGALDCAVHIGPRRIVDSKE